MKDVATDKRRQFIFKWIAVSLPLLLLILLEGILRLFHYGNDTSLFIGAKDRPGFVQTNPYVSSRFFNNREDAPTSYTQTFPRRKPDNSFRIFVLGESSALGFPYQHRGSFPRMLEYRLQKTFPERRIEMINLSITAISSYTLLSFTDEVLKMQPDAILIYTGHNEYYGAMGVGSGHRMGLNRSVIRSVIWFRQSRVVQLAVNLAAWLRGLFVKRTDKQAPGMMSKMAGEQEIPLGSKLYELGLRQFADNMDELLDAYHKQGIPVFFSNLVSNERGQRPFISKLKASTDSSSFLLLYQKAKNAWAALDTTLALSAAMEAWQQDSTHAANNYLIAGICYAKQDFGKAAEFYKRSKESDALRFRAPEAINGIIQELSRKYDNIHFVDARKEFDSAGNHHIADNDLFTDHLHPNIDGYFLIADAFYRTMRKTGLIGSWAGDADAGSVRYEIPVSAVDSIYGGLVILFMKEEWPFFEPASYNKQKEKTYPEHLAIGIFLKQMDWAMAMDSLYDYYLDKKDYAGALRTAKEVGMEHPYQWKLSAEVGQICNVLKDYGQSLWYFRRSFSDSNTVEVARKIVFDQLQLDSLGQALPYLRFISDNEPSDAMSQKLAEKIREILTLKQRVETDPRDLPAMKKLAATYLYLRNKQAAKLYIDMALVMAPKDSIVLAQASDLKKL